MQWHQIWSAESGDGPGGGDLPACSRARDGGRTGGSYGRRLGSVSIESVMMRGPGFPKQS
jgi:hypothetical protein